MSILLRRVCRRKWNRDDPIYRFTITPSINDYCWNTAIKQSEKGERGGISIKAFGDMWDKIVIHPGHLKYDFNYYWGRKDWGAKSCWNEKVTKETIIKANKQLDQLGRELCNLGYIVWSV